MNFPLARTITFIPLWLILLALCGTAELIPDRDLEKVSEAVEKARKTKPKSSARELAYKRTLRRSKSILKSHPEAKNRFELLKIMFECQKVILKLDESERNRKALLDVCEELKKAPDEWADIRLEADLLSMEFRLSEEDASQEEREQAMESLMAKYEDTTVDAKCLMLCAMLSERLGLDQLSRSIERNMGDRFGDDPEIIAFRRNVMNFRSLAVKCNGLFERSDGKFIHVPGDRMGHQVLMVYWTKESANAEKFLNQVEAERKKYPGAFEVFSFNLDELPDAGESYLREKGFSWSAMHLPGGQKNLHFQAYGGNPPFALFVNAFGYAVLNPLGHNIDGRVGVHGVHGGVFKVSGSRLSHDRYLAQLRSVLIGDFLVTDSYGGFDALKPPEVTMILDQENPFVMPEMTGESVPPSVLKEIQSRLILPPFRFRMSPEESLAMYQEIQKLSQSAIERYPNANNLWVARNRRVVALLGMWNLAKNPSDLNLAVEESEKILSTDIPEHLKTVARFCLVRLELRDGKKKAETEIRKMMAGDEENKTLSLISSAAVLAIESDHRSLHEELRQEYLSRKPPQSMQAMTNFLTNRYQRYNLLRPNTTRGDRMAWTRGSIVNHQWNPNAQVFPEHRFKKLDESDFVLPRDTSGNLTLLLFLEPPEDPSADFPILLDRNGKPTKNDVIRKVVSDAKMMAETHLGKSVRVVLAFLCDDAKRVAHLVSKNEWKGEVVMVPGGINHPMVQELDILSADRIPNVFLLRRDGKISWKGEGYLYKSEFGFPFAFLLGMKAHIEMSDVEFGYEALKKGEFAKANQLFTGPFVPINPDRYGWRPPRHHGRALALVGMGKWGEALEAVNVAIDAQKPRYYRYPGRRPRAADWRPPMTAMKIKEGDESEVICIFWKLKAKILKELGRAEAAEALLKRASVVNREDRDDLYLAFHQRLDEL